MDSQRAVLLVHIFRHFAIMFLNIKIDIKKIKWILKKTLQRGREGERGRERERAGERKENKRNYDERICNEVEIVRA